MKRNNLDNQLREEGFEPLAMYHNASFGSQEKVHTTPPLKEIIEDRHLSFRIIPAYLVFDDAPKEYRNRHMIYISKNTQSKVRLLDGCEVDTDI